MRSCVGKPNKNTMGMGMHKIIEQMGKVDLENRTNIVTLKKWLTVTLN
jgi:hypothetical protein